MLTTNNIYFFKEKLYSSKEKEDPWMIWLDPLAPPAVGLGLAIPNGLDSFYQLFFLTGTSAYDVFFFCWVIYSNKEIENIWFFFRQKQTNKSALN